MFNANAPERRAGGAAALDVLSDGNSSQVPRRVPRILLATTCSWPLAARLAIIFADAGCRVEVVCPHGHPASRTSAVFRTRTYHALAPLTSFRRAIRKAEHDLVVPCDDLAATHL